MNKDLHNITEPFLKGGQSGMNNTFHSIAEPFIFDFKQSIDEICEKYGHDSLLEALVEAGKEYDVMRRAELEVIMGSLAHLKKRVDSLFEDCLTISGQLRAPDEAASEAFEGDQISLMEMLKALES